MADHQSSLNGQPVQLRYNAPCTGELRKQPFFPILGECTAVLQKIFGEDVACIEVREFGGGLFNKVYLLTTHVGIPRILEDVPDTVLLRVARGRKAGSDISLDSEVATMVYVRQNTSIPIPHVYGYCVEANNPIVGLPFMVISFMSGLCPSLSSDYFKLDMEAQLRTIKSYAHIVSQLASLHFDTLGSLYFDPRSESGSQQVEVGPICWAKGASKVRKTLPIHDCGPWENAVDWLEASVCDEMQLLKLRPDLLCELVASLDLENDRALAIRMYDAVLPRIRRIISGPFSGGPFFLSHVDLTFDNILIEPSGPEAGKIVAVLDWEMAATLPLWAVASCPRWFDTPMPGITRKPMDAAACRNTYFAELRRLGHDETFIQLAQEGERKRRFAEVVTLPWYAADALEVWLRANPEIDWEGYSD